MTSRFPRPVLAKPTPATQIDSHAQSCSVTIANGYLQLCCIVPMSELATHDIKSCSEMQGMQGLAAGGAQSGSHMTTYISGWSTGG